MRRLLALLFLPLFLTAAVSSASAAMERGDAAMRRGGMGMMDGADMMNGRMGMMNEHMGMLPAHSTMDRVRTLSGFGDRAVGAPGNAAAADYIEHELTRLLPGASVGRQSFLLPFKRHGGASLVLTEGGSAGKGDGPDDGVRVDVRPLDMNVLSTGAIAGEGVSGPLYYAGRGRLADFDGMDVAGAVVLMDLESGKNWVNAARLGAKALIFLGEDLEETPAPRSLFEDKLELTPLDFPRFWMPRSQALSVFGDLDALRPGERVGRVRLTAKAYWDRAETWNVYAFIPGSDPDLSKEVVFAQAFYDNTAFVPGNAPGADEAASAATLLDLAERLGRNPPKRSMLLLATSGHAEGVAGMRQFTWFYEEEGETLERIRSDLEDREAKARLALDALAVYDPYIPLPPDMSEEEHEQLRAAYRAVVKQRVDDLSTRLMRLRLEPEASRDAALIKTLAARRLALKRLDLNAGQGGTVILDEAEKELVADMHPDAVAGQEAVLRDAGTELRAVESGLKLRRLVKDLRLVASVSLHLSSRGDGIGAFERGWLYELRSRVNRSRLFSHIDEVLRAAAKELPDGGMFHDTLRPSRLSPWQGFLPDRPQLGGEPMALAALPGFTLATTQDARAYWGTPYDTVKRVDGVYLGRQSRLVAGLVRALSQKPLPDPGSKARSGFCLLSGRAHLLRQGELFPDRPATETVFLTYQGPSRFLSMVDTAGNFRVPGLMLKKHTIHKAILEGFRFDRDTGLAVWAVDKPSTGKAAYRVKMQRLNMETDLVLFGCGQTTMYSMLEPRTFRALAVPELIDARTEARPLKYWYSRLDTHSSTLGTFFLQPDVPLKLILSDNFIEKKAVLLNADAKHPMGKGFLIGDWPTVPMTTLQAANDMWSLLTPRVANLEERGIVNDRIRDMRRRGVAALGNAERFKAEKRWDRCIEEAGKSLAIASQVYNDVDKTQKDVLAGVLFYIALFVPFAYCLERLFFGFVSIHKRIVAFLGLLGVTIAVISQVHPAFELTYSPMVVILAFFIIGLSALVSLIIFARFEREMEELQRRSKHFKVTEIGKAKAFGAAFVLGVSNLRRRPVRTFLTCVTLIILTFTIMNFTAVKSVSQKGWGQFSEAASYDGVLLKYFGWQDLPVEALSTVNNAFLGRGVVAPRVWYVTEDQTRAPLVPVMHGGESSNARGIIGLSAAEPRVSGLDEGLVGGRWFAPGEDDAVILPANIAAALGIDPGRPGERRVTIWGMPFRVVGVMADDGLDAHPDLDGEPVTPIVYPSEADTQLSEMEAEAVLEGEDVVSYQSRYQHVPGDQVVILPARVLLSLGGGAGRLKGVAVSSLHAGMGGMMSGSGMSGDMGERMERHMSGAMGESMGRRMSRHMGMDERMGGQPEGAAEQDASDDLGPGVMAGTAAQASADLPGGMTDSDRLAKELGDRFGLMLFRGGPNGTSLFYSADAMNYSGVSNILIPLIISVLIVLNTMIGSVYERKREIGVYTSIGLAPTHVGFLFVAESLAFAVISVVAGYLVAQGAAALLAGTPVWAGMTANYSSMAGVFAMILVILVVLASVIYPARVAADIAIPDVNRSWQMPKAKGDRLNLTLPFLVNIGEQASAGGFLYEYYQAHRDVSHGLFSTDDMDSEFLPPEKLPLDAPPDFARLRELPDLCLTMKLRVWLAPFDFGVRQKITLIFCPSVDYPGFMEIKVRLRREAGERMSWQNLNRNFLNDLRKQLLVWRSLSGEAAAGFEECLTECRLEGEKYLREVKGMPMDRLRDEIVEQADSQAGAPPEESADASAADGNTDGEGRA